MKRFILLTATAMGLVMTGQAMATDTAAEAKKAAEKSTAAAEQAAGAAQSVTESMKAAESKAAEATATAETAASKPAQSASTPTEKNSEVAEMTVPAETQESRTILDLAASSSEFSTLTKAIKAAGLEDTLTAKGPITVFAPTNAAFAKLGQQKLNELMKPENKAQLTEILSYHVVPNTLPPQAAEQTSAPESTNLPTAQGQSLKMKQQGATIMVDKAKSVGSSMEASNGKVIAIDSVLMPTPEAKMTAPTTPVAIKAPSAQAPQSPASPSTMPAVEKMAPSAPASPASPAAPSAPIATQKPTAPMSPEAPTAPAAE